MLAAGAPRVCDRSRDTSSPSAIANCTWNSPRPRKCAAPGRGGATTASVSWIHVTRCKSSIPGKTRPTSTACAPPSTSSARPWSTPRASRANGKATTSSSRPRAWPRTTWGRAKLARPAFVTVFHNRILVHNQVEIQGNTAYDRPPAYTPHTDKLPLTLMYHGDPVRFRNIWVREFRELEGKKAKEKN